MESEWRKGLGRLGLLNWDFDRVARRLDVPNWYWVRHLEWSHNHCWVFRIPGPDQPYVATDFGNNAPYFGWPYGFSATDDRTPV